MITDKFLTEPRMITDKFLTEPRMITDKFLTDIAVMVILDDNERNNADNCVYNMTTNNDCLMELDADHNTLENCTVKKV